MKRQRKDTSFRPDVLIYHHEIDLENINGTTIWLITEIAVGGEPQRTYYYQIPSNYKDDSLLGELHERYAKYCPN
jgi:hypothetical protein